MSSGITATVRSVGKRKIVGQRAALVLTQAAIDRIKSLLSHKPDAVGLKVGVKQRGCNGLTYTLDYAKEKGKLDEEVVQDGVRLLIDSKAQLTLIGTEMDYVESKLSSEFVFNNPNVKGTCGCGESFTV
ncbi:iron-sulfur cluster assembly 1-like protein [Leptotrombidium deliense]|uniref:Iron-sulfur cluster assembly 1 homolog, mitochondrial n=1 Tax=Leptotrombidium deliense TaxID=299467 RepID=A0A443SN39_9ACAR|nr:iron-sulfur cluster assembly 1-like protein [Leptotrombidium deliense]